jgi:hypothetical protein
VELEDASENPQKSMRLSRFYTVCYEYPRECAGYADLAENEKCERFLANRLETVIGFWFV